MLGILSTAALGVFCCAGVSVILPWSNSTDISEHDSQWVTQDGNQSEVYIDQFQ